MRVLGRVESYGGRLQIAVRDLEKIEAGDPLDLVPGARRDAETLEGFVEFLAGEIAHPGLRALLDRFLADAASASACARRPRPRPTTTTPAGCSSTPWRWRRCAARRRSCTRA